jgi:uracil phosphoribosyltransferase
MKLRTLRTQKTPDSKYLLRYTSRITMSRVAISQTHHTTTSKTSSHLTTTTKRKRKRKKTIAGVQILR